MRAFKSEERNNENYNIVELLLDLHVQNKRGQHIAIINDEKSITYQELLNQCLKFAENTEFEKCKPGSVVACIMEDSIEAVICFLSLIRMDLVPCFINPNLSIAEYTWYIQTCSASFTLMSFSVAQKLAEILINAKINFKIVNDFKESSAEKIPTYKEIHFGNNERPAFCLFTSGTTGHPSAIFHRHLDIAITNKQYARHILKVNQDDVLFSTSKLFFAYGLNSLLFALYHGATAILSPKVLDASVIWKILGENQPTIFFSVPVIYARLLRFDCPSKKLLNLRLCISAGEHLPEKIYKEWNDKTQHKIIDGIGTTEVLSTFISNRPEDILPNCTGKLVPGFQAMILNEDNNQVEDNEIGVLWIKGETYDTKYLNNDSATKDRFVDGWFKTNDLFSKNQQGRFYYHGRANDLIKTGGIWIYPYRIEQILNQHPAVFECAIIGESQSNDLIRPVAYVVLNENFKPSLELESELKQLCKQQGAYQEYPHFIKFINEIPKTSSGKLKRYLLKNIKTQKHEEKFYVN